ncbi:hypothetical protein CJ178_30720 [Rhodococcus sp. ACPA4]|uniref:hypothetical protein n=1 Tax=Rhodococcus sp. ACPA4 TaxID=2028571 RepID=UPI000BB13C78|nr:hypothetical protein [Rhodococcus sp. ACPA4]PBC35831.1 hypothetical protein CJ178_30720 [Rhodococcus sp. ACPA4]
MSDYLSITAQLGWVCDAVIPADASLGMPSASEAGVITDLLPRALEVRDDQKDRFIEIVGALPSSTPADALGSLESGLPAEDFDLVAHLIAGAYYLNPDVNAKLGYQGQEAMSYDPDYDEINEVAERIVARGPVYIDPLTGQRALAQQT